MPKYKYTALGSDGRRTAGVIDAPGETEATRRLAADGITPLRIRETASRGAAFSWRHDRITQREVSDLTREISVLVEANIPIARGLRSVAEHEKNPRMRDMVTDIAIMIESGEKLTTAFGKYEHVFGEVYIETIRAAEKTGTLASVTEHLADMLERSIESREQVRRALTYPTIVAGFVVMAVSVIVVFVVPRFAVIFESNGVQLPVSTRLIRTLGDSVHGWWWVYAVVLVAILVFARQQWRSPRGRYRIESVLLRTPYIGTMLTAVATARFSRVMSISIDSGIEVIESIWIAGRSTGRPVFVAECERLCDRMRAGDSLEAVLNGSDQLPSFARRLLGAGKEAKELSGAGRIIARHYDRIADHLSKNINTVIEPMITIAIAVIVLIVALSVFLPMWQMVTVNR
ncbi:MAG: type II secretion system F family protein [Phycisphaerales bacterium]|nr:type II secretion system F family protein [Planctomycetota bacterium]MCH8508268.1 type II secretion system F family protein [Phycisphaerales bacterium]